VTLEAVPDYGWRFDGWSGDVSGTDNPITITVSGDLSITATFVTSGGYMLTLSKSGGPGSVKVNGTEHSLPWSGQFAAGTEVTLEAVVDAEEDFLGWSGDLVSESNPVTITMDRDKSITANFVCSGTFKDVPCDYWCFKEVEAVYNAGIVVGYPDGYYRPTWPVDRAAMAVYVTRALVGGAESVPEGPEEPSFPDVPTEHWAFDAVEYAVAHNVVQGYADGKYHPDWTITRAQMSVFIARSIVEPTGEDGLASYLPPDTPTFEDVPPTFWCYKHVEYLAEVGGLTGYPDGLYHPTWQVSRDQMAVYIARAFELPM